MLKMFSVEEIPLYIGKRALVFQLGLRKNLYVNYAATMFLNERKINFQVFRKLKKTIVTKIKTND